ncbi:MAG: ferric reductase-like transmembrane domain-containing protein [Coriobacteriia bacterium]|nr:ferric reductase-like transmembrane domain-containing protein [Coriobacteriia bacterium]
MDVIIALLLSFVFAYACAGVLKKHPVPFYIAFALVGAVYISGVLGSTAPAAELALLPFLRRASLAFCLFSVVMFVGVLPESSALRHRLAPVRGQLSLLATILIIVHVLGYAANYLATVLAGTASPWVLCGILTGVVVAVLLAILAATSITPVRKAMEAASWKKLQKLAYPFYVLMYAHLLFMLVPSSMLGGNSAMNLVVYTVVFVAYVILRLMKASKDKRGE